MANYNLPSSIACKLKVSIMAGSIAMTPVHVFMMLWHYGESGGAGKVSGGSAFRCFSTSRQNMWLGL